MVPAWTLVLAFVAGLAVGLVLGRLVMGRPRSTEPVAPAAPTPPEPTAPVPTAPAREASATAAAAAEPEVAAEPEIPAAAVENVVAELERRVKGRRTEGEADRPAGNQSGQRE